MAIPDRDTVYNADGSPRDPYVAERSSSAGWVIGGIIVVALVVIGYFVFAGHPSPEGVTVNNTPAVTTPATPAPSATPAPATTTDTNTSPMNSTAAPATSPATPSTAAPAASTAAPATTTPAPAGQ